MILYHGPIIGAVRVTQRSKWTSAPWQRYQAFKTRIRILADIQMVPRDLQPDDDVTVEVMAFFNKRARADADNVLKGVVDALFKRDRRVLSLHVKAIENTGKPERLTIMVTFK